jgi:pimeloyl-ACP methyl ester carboxylesterase
MLTLVLLPGMDGTGKLFAPFIAAIGTEFKTSVVAYPTNEPLGYQELESIVRAALPVDEPFAILAESFSGPIAISIAKSCGPQLKGVVLVCTFVRNPRPAFAALRYVIGFLIALRPPVRILSYFLLNHFSTPALRSALAEALAGVSRRALWARLRAIVSLDVSSELKTFAVSVIYLRASRDRLVPFAAAKLISELCPIAEVNSIEAPHLLLQTVPDEAARTVAAFLRRIGNNAPL